jgi:hypothetical protein
VRKIENLTIDDIRIRQHEVCPNGVIIIEWSANIGFGRYDLVLGDDGILHAYTECMDRGEDKEFTKMILDKLAEKIVIED